MYIIKNVDKPRQQSILLQNKSALKHNLASQNIIKNV